MKNKYIIEIEGCHDNTVFVMELTDYEVQIISEVEYYCLEEEIEDE